MDKRVLFIVALLSGYSFNVLGQQFKPVDESGELEYEKACKEYYIDPSQSITMFNDYLDKYPDSRHRNRVESLIATAYFKEGRYKEAIAILNSCDIDDINSSFSLLVLSISPAICSNVSAKSPISSFLNFLFFKSLQIHVLSYFLYF